jgi:hypothetical protein
MKSHNSVPEVLSIYLSVPSLETSYLYTLFPMYKLPASSTVQERITLTSPAPDKPHAAPHSTAYNS